MKPFKKLLGWKLLNKCEDDSHLFWEAVKEHDLSKLNRLIQTGWNVNAKLKVERHNQPKHHLATIPFSGTSTKSETIWLYTPLHASIEKQWKAGVDLLLEYGANVQAKAVEVNGRNKCSCLMIAAYYGDIQMVQKLLKLGCDVNFRSRASGENALIEAALGKNVDCLKCLLLSGAEVNNKQGGSYMNPLLTAVKFDNPIEGQTRYTDPSDRTDGPEEVEPKYQMVKLLLEYGADVHAEVGGVSALMESIYWRDTRILDALVDAGADVNKRIPKKVGVNTLRKVVHRGSPGAVKKLIYYGADVWYPYEDFTILESVFVFYMKTHAINPLLLSGATMTPIAYRELEMCVCDYIEVDLFEAGIIKRPITHRELTSYMGQIEQLDLYKEHIGFYPLPKKDPALGLRVRWDPYNTATREMMIWAWKFIHEVKSLRWICRTFLRRDMKLFKPIIVKKLPLPKTLQEYILCADLL